MQFTNTLEAVLAGKKTSSRRVAKPMAVQAGRRTRRIGDFETSAVEIVDPF